MSTEPARVLDTFYRLMARLAEAPAQGQPLKDLPKKLPQRGVYFFFEEGEMRGVRPAVPRVVRVGTHAVSRGSKTTLRNRLKQHLGTRDGRGNHRGSIFRLHVGAAILRRDGVALPSWGAGSTRPQAVRDDPTALAAEEEHERLVSHHIGRMRVCWISVPDEAGPASARSDIERNAISLLAGVSHDSASPTWLGGYSPREEIRRSALWNLNYLEGPCDITFLDRFELFVESTRSQ